MNDRTPGVLVELQQPVRMSSLRNCPADRVGRKVVLGFSFDELVDFGILVPKVEATLAKVGDDVIPLFALDARQAEKVLASVTLKEPSLALELLVAVQVAIREFRSELDELALLQSPVLPDGNPTGSRRKRLEKTLDAARRLKSSLDHLTHGDLATLDDSRFYRQRFHDCTTDIALLVEIIEKWASSPSPAGRPSRYWEVEFVGQLKQAFEISSGEPAARTREDATRPDHRGPFERFVSTVLEAAGLKKSIQTSLVHLIRSVLEREGEMREKYGPKISDFTSGND